MAGKKTEVLHLIGAGSIGSFAAFLFAIIGRNISLSMAIYDFDKVERHNTENQIYRDLDVGRKDNPVFKARALEKILKEFSPAPVKAVRHRVGENDEFVGTVIVMVDSLEERRKIFQAVRFHSGVKLYIDARSGGTSAVVYALDPRDPDDVRLYESTLKGKGAAAPCADANTIPTLFAIASVIGKLLAEFLSGNMRGFKWYLIDYVKSPTIRDGTFIKEAG